MGARGEAGPPRRRARHHRRGRAPGRVPRDPNASSRLWRLDNRCPHQGGRSADGQIEDGYLICPWHAYQYGPGDRQAPPGVRRRGHAYPVEERRDGAVGRAAGRRRGAVAHGPAGRRAVRLGPRRRVRDGRPLQPRPGRRPPQGGGGRPAHLRRHPPRGRRRLRRQRLRQAHRPARRPASPSPAPAPPTC